jgi:hypothetical protein
VKTPPARTSPPSRHNSCCANDYDSADRGSADDDVATGHDSVDESRGSPWVTEVAVASYLAKYATKSTEPARVPPGRITKDNARLYADRRSHQGRMIAACLKLGACPHPDFRALRRWAHMLGYRGHFATKSRHYSTTICFGRPVLS